MPGQKLNYKVEYANEGEGIAFGVYFTDTLDENLNDKTLEIGPVIDVKSGLEIAPPGTYDPQTRTITWLVGEVGSAQGGYAEFSINVKNDALDGTEIINFATVYFPSVPEETRTNGIVNKVTTVMDNIPPITTATLSPSANPAGWNNTDVTISLSASDNEGGTGVKEIHYKLTGAISEEETVSADSAQMLLTTEGITNLVYWAIDNAGNVETQHTLTIKIDKTPPLISLNLEPYRIKLPFRYHNFHFFMPFFYKLSYSATDSLSGLKELRAGLLTPNIDAFKTKLIKGKHIHIILDETRKHLLITAPNPEEILNQLRTNLFLIDNNQIMHLNQRPKLRIWTITKLDRFLIIKAPSITFKAEAKDYADNSATKELTYVKKRILLPEYIKPLIKRRELSSEEIEELMEDAIIDVDTLKIIHNLK